MLQKDNRLPHPPAEARAPACVQPPVRGAAVAVEAVDPVEVNAAVQAAVQAVAEAVREVVPEDVQRAVTAVEVLAREGAEKDAIRLVMDVQNVQMDV